jgi:hypothetical protein
LFEGGEFEGQLKVDDTFKIKRKSFVEERRNTFLVLGRRRL